jgi:hypothetical protein
MAELSRSLIMTHTGPLAGTQVGHVRQANRRVVRDIEQTVNVGFL